MSNWIHTSIPTSNVGISYGLGNIVYSTNPYTYASNAINISTTPRTKLVAHEIVLNDIDLESRLAKIEERLGILNTNSDLEERWAELRELSNKYKSLEKEIVEKEKIWNTLKGVE